MWMWWKMKKKTKKWVVWKTRYTLIDNNPNIIVNSTPFSLPYFFMHAHTFQILLNEAK